MTDEKQAFDPYHVWLGIPPKDQPPNHYRLLGLELFEDNTDVIDAAANRQSSYLHSIAAGPHRRESQKLLNEVAAARLCLLDAAAKANYDQQLKSKSKGDPPPLIVVDTESEKSYRKVQPPKARPAENQKKKQPLGLFALVVVIVGLAVYLLTRGSGSNGSKEQKPQATQPAFSFEE